MVPANALFGGLLFLLVLKADNRGLQVVLMRVTKEAVLFTTVVQAEDRCRCRPSLNHSVLIAVDPTGENVDAFLELVITVGSRGIISTTVPGDK